jgi:hypothetical protein
MNAKPEYVSVEDVNSDVFCPEWWARIHVVQGNNVFRYKPCCLYRGISGQSAENPNTIYDSYNNAETVIKARENNLKGLRDPGCAMCYEAEDRGITSSRQWKIMEYGKQNIPVAGYLDLNLGNLCNLACAICGPWNSTKWASKAPIEWKYEQYTEKYLKNKPHHIDDPDLFLSLHTIQLQGGEVFLEKSYYDFFYNIGKYRTYTDLRVIIFTNGTVRPSDEFWNILTQCGTVELFFSIDDMGQRFEYQRDGAVWDKVVDNLRWFRDTVGENFKLNINPTYSMLNIFYLAELHQFMRQEFPTIKINYNCFNDHEMSRAKCQASAMTADVRAICLDRVKNIPELSFLSAYINVSTDNPYKKFLDYISHFDRMSGKSYAETHPEFYKLITNDIL